MHPQLISRPGIAPLLDAPADLQTADRRVLLLAASCVLHFSRRQLHCCLPGASTVRCGRCTAHRQAPWSRPGHDCNCELHFTTCIVLNLTTTRLTFDSSTEKTVARAACTHAHGSHSRAMKESAPMRQLRILQPFHQASLLQLNPSSLNRLQLVGKYSKKKGSIQKFFAGF